MNLLSILAILILLYLEYNPRVNTDNLLIKASLFSVALVIAIKG